MFWGLCGIGFIVAIGIGMIWGDEVGNSTSKGAIRWGLAAIFVFIVAGFFVAGFGPKGNASWIDYIVEDVGGDMYYVDEDGSHKIDTVYAPQFDDVKYPTYRITTYSWDNWPAFPDKELLIPREMSTND